MYVGLWTSSLVIVLEDFISWATNTQSSKLSHHVIHTNKSVSHVSKITSITEIIKWYPSSWFLCVFYFLAVFVYVSVVSSLLKWATKSLLTRILWLFLVIWIIIVRICNYVCQSLSVIWFYFLLDCSPYNYFLLEFGSLYLHIYLFNMLLLRYIKTLLQHLCPLSWYQSIIII